MTNINLIPYAKSSVKNFSIHKQKMAKVQLEQGLVVGAEVKVVFGTGVDVLDAYNKLINSENNRNVEVFLNKDQARDLYAQLKNFLQSN